ncbi:DUF3817 domain-containing protein [Actinomycetota bacterium]
MSTPTIKDPKSVRTALTLFKVTSIAAGLAMFVLIAEMVMKYAMHNDSLAWWSPVHGFIFLVFALATFNLGLKLRWGFGRMIGILLAACIPFVAFIMEKRVAREVEPQLAGSLAS